MSRRRYFEERRSGNGAIYHCVKTEIEPGGRIRLFKLMNKIKSDTISQDMLIVLLLQQRWIICIAMILYICLIIYIKYNYMIYNKLLYIGGGVIPDIL